MLLAEKPHITLDLSDSSLLFVRFEVSVYHYYYYYYVLPVRFVAHYI